MIATVAIIGGGLSGSLVAIQLLNRATQPLRIQLIEPANRLGRGVAYGTNFEGHLLNVPAGGMSLFPDQPFHFLNWLQCYAPEYAQLYRFVPRSIYGDYVAFALQVAQTKAPTARLERVHHSVTDLEPVNGGALVYGPQGPSFFAQRVVLALGNFQPSDPPVANRSFYTSPRYVSYAWSARALADLSPTDSILLIGAGLTTLDLVRALVAQGHQGPIHALSRWGLLPLAHSYPAPSLTLNPLLPLDHLPTVAELLHLVRARISAGADWRVVLDALRMETPEIWQALPLTERQRFLRHLRPYWQIHHHRCAPEVMLQMQQLLATGQLRLHSGRIQGFQETETEVLVTMRARATQALEQLRVQRVINCTGPECDYRKFQNPLVVNLLRRGLIRPDPLALGLDATAKGALLDQHGQPSNWLYTLGPPLKGVLWETTSVPSIRVQAQDLVREFFPTAAGFSSQTRYLRKAAT